MDKEISSRDNPAVKRYVRLAGSRKARREEGLFVTEGLKLTRDAFEAGLSPVELFATEQALERSFDAIQEIALSSDDFYRVGEMVAEKLAQSVSNQGVFGIFRMLDNRTQPVKISNNGRYILLSSLQDPGNLGTILRTAAAFGVDGVFLSDDCPDLYSPKVLRASMGGVFRAPVETGELSEIINRLREAGVAVWSTGFGTDAVRVQDANLGGGGRAVLIGNEGGGVAPEVAEQCSGVLAIPMEPGCESLNAAMAAGVLLWEMYR